MTRPHGFHRARQLGILGVMAQTSNTVAELVEAPRRSGDWLDLRAPQNDAPDSDGRYGRPPVHPLRRAGAVTAMS